MGKSCAVYGCLSTHHEKGRHFYKFPTEDGRSKQWIQAVGRPELGNKSKNTLHTSYYVCDLHFQSSDRISRRLKLNAVPTLNLAFEDQAKPSKMTQTDGLRYIESPKEALLPVEVVNVVIQADNSTQTTPELSTLTTPCKRKLEIDLNNECKKCISFKKQKKQSTFINKNLSPKLKKLINLQSLLKQNSRGNRYNRKYKLFALKIYFASPVAYRVLAGTLSLPSERTLRRMKIEMGTSLYPDVLECLYSKLQKMKDVEKYCVICADEMKLKRNLQYKINEDKIIGFHEIDGVQEVEPASQAFVIMARGIFSEWNQPIGYSLLAQNKNYKELNNWLDDVILKMTNMGYNIVAFVSNQGPKFLHFANERNISPDYPYFVINGKKIFYIFDVPHLMKSLRNNLMKYDFEFQDSDETKLTAKWEDIKKIYSFDSQRSYRLAPKLMDLHINPNSIEKTQLKIATQVFSSTVAAALNISIECGLLEQSAIGTVKFIDLIDKTFDVLNSSAEKDNNKYKNAFASESYQNELLDRFESFLLTVAVLDEDRKNVTNAIRCLKNFKISLQSIRCLASDLQAEGFAVLYTQRLNQDPIEDFFESIRQEGGYCREPTPHQFTKHFQKLFMANMLNDSDNANCSADFDQLLMTTDDISDQPINEESLEISVGPVDYRFELPDKNAFTYVCRYLINKCFDIHKCEKITKFTQECNAQKTSDHIVKMPLLTTFKNFVDCVKEMDNCIKQCFQQNMLDKVGNQILEEMKDISFNDCCECFPNEYLKKLFVRFRIYNIIQTNNKLFSDKSIKQKCFSVSNI